MALPSRTALRAATLGLLAQIAAAVAMPDAGAAATLKIEPGGERLAEALSRASPGDILVLEPGIHNGPVVIGKSLVLEGRAGAVIDGGGASRVITVDAPDVTVRGIKVTGSGGLLETEDSGIFITRKGDRALIANNRIEGNLIGVYLKGPKQARVSGNRIIGLSAMRLAERGNGVQLWNTPGSIIENNEISAGRDGIFVTTSKRNIFRRNRIHGVRFAIHYMYTNDSEVSGNVSRGNHLGYAIMYSSRIR
ncbi:MAG TPA: nitrous oxide reductase family maturation protein NosD, partial [Rhizobiales bacterium]|nr:nitrous oxide reductase family maturation protein NosD [Hyphomicrobiales bacterium]